MYSWTQVVLIVFSLLLTSVARSEEVQANRPFKVAYAESWAPISSGQGESVQGILPSIIDEVVSRRMGIEVVHQGFPWARAQEMVRSGGVDAFITTPTMERMVFSSASREVVFTLRFQPVVRAGSEEERLLRSEEDLTRHLASRRYCDVLGNGWAAQFYKDKALAYVVVPTIDICLKHLAEGKTDIVVHATPVVQSFISQLDLTEQIVILPLVMSSSPDFPLLLSKESSFDKEFLEKFDETLAEIKALGIWEVLVNPGAVSSN